MHLESFWDTQVRNENRKLITSTPPRRVMDVFEKAAPFRIDVVNARSVLELGPGYGKMLEWIRLMNPACELHCADISSEVLNKLQIEGLIKHGMDNWPKVELFYCFLVVQHCSPDVLDEWLPKIKADKIYIQYRRPVAKTPRLYFNKTAQGRWFYTHEEMKKRVSALGWNAVSGDGPSGWGVVYGSGRQDEDS